MRYYLRLSFLQIQKLKLREINFPRYIHGYNQQATLCNTEDHLREATHSPGRWPHLLSPSHWLPSGQRCPCSSSNMPNVPLPSGPCTCYTSGLKRSSWDTHISLLPLSAQTSPSQRSLSGHTLTQSAQLPTQLDYLAFSTTWIAIYLLFFFFFLCTYFSTYYFLPL